MLLYSRLQFLKTGAGGRFHGFGNGNTGGRKGIPRLRAGNAQQNQAVARNLDADLGAQHVHLQALGDRFDQIAGEGEQVVVALTPDDEAGNHSPLGAAPGGMLHTLGAEVIDIAGELVVQEIAGIVTPYPDNAQMVQRSDNRSLAGCGEFARSIAEVDDGFVVENGASGAQRVFPVGVHLRVPVRVGEGLRFRIL